MGEMEAALQGVERLRDLAPSELAKALVGLVLQTEGPSGLDLWMRKACERLRESGTRLDALADALAAEAPTILNEIATPEQEVSDMHGVRVPVEGEE